MSTLMENEKTIDNNSDIVKEFNKFFKSRRNTLNIQKNYHKVVYVEYISNPVEKASKNCNSFQYFTH